MRPGTLYGVPQNNNHRHFLAGVSKGDAVSCLSALEVLGGRVNPIGGSSVRENQQTRAKLLTPNTALPRAGICGAHTPPRLDRNAGCCSRTVSLCKTMNTSNQVLLWTILTFGVERRLIWTNRSRLDLRMARKVPPHRRRSPCVVVQHRNGGPSTKLLIPFMAPKMMMGGLCFATCLLRE